MTTLQPRLVRADTLDLQSQTSPSAKDHTRSPTYSSFSQNTTGAHHREALRNAEQSAYIEKKASPRVSVDDNRSGISGQTHLYDSADEDGDEDARPGAHGSIQQGGEYEDAEIEDDEDLDDDLADRISSSPSIEDGKYSPTPWALGFDTMARRALVATTALPPRGNPPSTCSQSTPHEEALYSHKETKQRPVSHHQGEHMMDASVESSRSELDTDLWPPSDIASKDRMCRKSGSLSGSHSQDSLASLTKYLLPIDDPLLDHVFDDLDPEVADPEGETYGDDDNEGDWIDEEDWQEDQSSIDDDTEEIFFTSDSRYIDSGWGGECLRETEDIDFEFVYALHTFVATVEGQANATKGDTMVLLDDSNSYWWLVRVVKDGSIGYLPAEHIETPTERLARLNKHRNIDLAAAMLGDNPEKSKNPLKKAMRRRNAKSVAFAPPIYYEPSDYLYSSDEDDEDGEESEQEPTQDQQAQQADQQDATKPDNEPDLASNGIRKAASDDGALNEPTSPVKVDVSESEGQLQDETFQRSRNGVVRNTDSFFKDDTAETKKISLTPALLRGDKGPTVAVEQERTSLDTFDRIDAEEKTKEDKKKKEKKGMLSGLFKRKDKKAGKTDTDEALSPSDSLTSPVSKDSLDSPINGPLSPDRKPGKLQKLQPSGSFSKSSPTDIRSPTKPLSITTSTISGSSTMTGSSQASVSSAITPTETGTITSLESHQTGQESMQAEQPASRPAAPAEKKSIFSPIATVLPVLKSSTAESDGGLPVKGVYSKRAKERFAIDVSDSEDEHTPRISPPQEENRVSISPVQDEHYAQNLHPDSNSQVSPIDSLDDYERPLQVQERAVPREQSNVTPVEGQGQSDTASTSKPSPSFIAHTPSTSRSTPTWSDASLRSYMDDDQDIRDLLIIVHDKSNITPVGPEHPLMGGLFMTERTRLAEMQTQLDSMLTDWISKRNPGLLSATK